MADVSNRDELYVGYLPVPPGQRRFLRWMVPTVLWLLCAVTLAWTLTQRSPGTGVWDTGEPVRLHGTIASRPYPILFAEGESGIVEGVLLVGVGKIGIKERVARLEGKPVTVTGWPLRRDGRRMLEIDATDDAIAVSEDGKIARPVPQMRTLGAATLRGEIVDSKCYLGAMKPGEGKTHKECATLCIRGGIPAVLVVRHDAGETKYYLLSGRDGGPLDPEAHRFIADPVEITGEVSDWGGISILRVDPADINRL